MVSQTKIDINKLSPREKKEYLSLLKKKYAHKSRKDLASFIQYTKEDYELEWFHEKICYWLDKLHKGEIMKLMIFLPPQHGKSEISSRRFPAYTLGRNPSTKIGVCSYSSDLAGSFNRDIQRIMDDPKYIELYPKTRLNSTRVSADSKNGELRNTNMFETVGHRGFVKTVGVGGSLTGTPLDLGIIDDPLKDRQDANSETVRENLWNWYNDVFLQRLHNDSKQLMLFTRWHEDDLAGRILDPKNEYYDEQEASEWTVIALPALKEKTKPVECAIDVNDPREIDEALWPSRHSAEKFIKSRRKTPRTFSSLQQQRPTAEGGNKIREDWFDIIDESELPFNPLSKIANFWIDGAYTEKTKNDPSALLSEIYHNGTLYILNCHGIRKELYEFLPYFKQYTRLNYFKRNSTVWIEPKASGLSMKSMLRKPDFGNFNVRTPPNKVVSDGKFNRVENSEAFMAGGKVVLVKGPWIKAFLDEICSFPNGTHDDMVDVLCYAVLHYFLKGEKSRGSVSITEG